MNIGIDARSLTEEKTGIGMYVQEILRELNKIDKENNYILYSTKSITLDFELNSNFKVKDNLKGIRGLWQYFSLPKYLSEDKIDIFWGTQNPLPKRNKKTKNIKYVFTVHDLAVKKLKNVGSTKTTLMHKMFLKKSIKNADEIIAISECTKKDIIELFGKEEKKINVIYNGTSLRENEKILSKEEEKEMAEKFKIENTPYLFFVSTIEPRKNIETLIRAFNYIRRKENKNLKLIIAGGLGWKYQTVLKLIDESDFKEDIIMPGYISEDEKQYLFMHAKCFVYPSLYEGFGLPVLEAMANKCLVITSNVSSLPEVGGNAAFYYESILNYGELGNKIIDVMSLNEEEKNQKIKEGLEQTKKFTWEKCGLETSKILNS